MQGKPTDKATEGRVLALLRKGHRAQRAAEECGVSPTVALRLCRENGIKVRVGGPTDAELSRAGVPSIRRGRFEKRLIAALGPPIATKTARKTPRQAPPSPERSVIQEKAVPVQINFCPSCGVKIPNAIL